MLFIEYFESCGEITQHRFISNCSAELYFASADSLMLAETLCQSTELLGKRLNYVKEHFGENSFPLQQVQPKSTNTENTPLTADSPLPQPLGVPHFSESPVISHLSHILEQNSRDREVDHTEHAVSNANFHGETKRRRSPDEINISTRSRENSSENKGENPSVREVHEDIKVANVPSSICPRELHPDTSQKFSYEKRVLDRTTLCRNILSSDFCHFGNRCHFGHSYAEIIDALEKMCKLPKRESSSARALSQLIQPPRNPPALPVGFHDEQAVNKLSRRVEICRNLLNEGKCFKEQECAYAHSGLEIKAAVEILQDFYRQRRGQALESNFTPPDTKTGKITMLANLKPPARDVRRAIESQIPKDTLKTFKKWGKLIKGNQKIEKPKKRNLPPSVATRPRKRRK